jgi:ADP-heptose:LPS heptosyltransferase/GT2 family glycosyltransferase
MPSRSPVRPAAKASPEVAITLDPFLPGGFQHGRHELLIRGCITADVPVEQVMLVVDGRARGQIQFGTAADSAPRAFVFHLARPAAQVADRCGFTIAARTDTDVAVGVPFVAVPHPDEAGAGTVVVGPTAPADSATVPPVMLYVDRALIDPTGKLLVEGWAMALSRVVAVQVLSGGERIGAAASGLPREDVGRAHTEYPNAAQSGFSFTATLAEMARRRASLRVEVICLDGSAHEVTVDVERVTELPPLQPTEVPAPAPDPIAQPRRAIQMHCDEALLHADGTLLASGWAVCAVGIAAIEVRLDGRKLGEAELGGPRPDVAQEHPDIAMARVSGFRFRTHVDVEVAALHQVTLVVRNGLDDMRAETLEVVALSTLAMPATLPKLAISTLPFRLEIDRPVVRDDVVAEIIGGRLLTIAGWSLAQAGVAAIEVFIDDDSTGLVNYGLARPDVVAACPDYPNALRVGFVHYCPLRSLRNGTHTVRVEARATDGATATRAFTIDVRKAEDVNLHARIRRQLPPPQVDLYVDVLNRLDFHPVFRLILRSAAPLDPAALETTLRSLASQAYDNWQLILADDAAAREICARRAVQFPGLSERIVAASDLDGFHFEPGYYGFLSPGDELGADALAEIAACGGLHRDADLIYADESRISPASDDREPFFKPDYAPDLLLSTNYIGRPWFASPALLRRAGIASEALRRAAEYDLVLRCVEQAHQICHVPKLLCHRMAASLDTPGQEQTAIAHAAERRGIAAEVLPGCIAGTWRLRRTSPARGLVSIIIPTRAAHGHIKACIETLRARTAYRDFEIIAIDNIPASEPDWKTWLAESADKIVTIDEPFNWSRFNNLAVAQARGDYLLFLNDDIEIIQDDWLDAMLEHAQRPEVGIVGPQLLYPDRKVQHAGMFLASLGLSRHAFRMSAADDPCYFGFALTQRNVMAVTGACMLVRRDSFMALGQFDEAHEVVNNDLDYCLRAHEAGLLTIYTPYATLIHHELASRDKLGDVFNTQHFHARWHRLFTDGDPYFNPRLSRHVDDFRPDDEPVQEIFVGHPHYRREDVRRILVVKLDHIGDFVTAIPAMRRLKELFPAATLHVLASRAARTLAAMESCIDGYIEFEFFHARSGLGQRELTEQDLQDLRERLLPYEFDLAVDLRRHTDTRQVLRYTGARLLAGCDHAGAFSYLDFALEWEEDVPLVRKRTHVSDALINLIDAIGTAFDTRRIELTLSADQRAKGLDFLTRSARQLFAKPVVAVQPGVGNAVRQWPPGHFAALIDLLVRRSHVNVVLIGGPDEQELADEVMAEVGERDEVLSLVGKTALGDLPVLLAACALYVGNNTGPKHIAAGLGVPTIGIHSGVVDAVEWGPLGKRAIALQRNMFCSPCYWVAPSDCPRDLACMKQLEPGLVHQYCELFLARPIEPPAAPKPHPPARATNKKARTRRRGRASV